MTASSSPHILVLAALLLAVATAQPGRFPCGTTSPNKRICDLLSHPTARRGALVPVDSECVPADAAGYFCGWAGARCTSDTQCDFGVCSSTDDAPGICLGGLGDSCQGPDGPDDSLCAGNLGCQTDGTAGQAVCGGAGADCSFYGMYQPGNKPNHGACISGHCNPSSLTCMIRPTLARLPPPAAPYYPAPPGERQDRYRPAPPPAVEREDLSIPAGASCPEGFTVCPVARRGSQGGYLFACFDTTTSASHCGGCPSIGAGFWDADGGEGVDCSALPGVQSTACVDSVCRIFSCSASAGYEFDRESNICVRKRYW